MGKSSVSESYSMWLTSIDNGIHLYKLKCDERQKFKSKLLFVFLKELS